VAPDAVAPTADVAAVLLAAGSGSRLGGRPKCLLKLDGVPLLQRTLDALRGAGVAEIVVVTGHHAERIEPLLQGQRFVRNPDPEASQNSSQRLGLAALSGRHAAVLVALADQPLLGRSELEALLAAWQGRPPGAEVLVPMVDGERGNPVVFSAAGRAAVLAGAAGARQWQDAHPGQVAPFVTRDRSYRVDIDTPQDLERFERETGRRLRLPTAG
jgi:CTP:molybdopterin cytidylyltransferase MocA